MFAGLGVSESMSFHGVGDLQERLAVHDEGVDQHGSVSVVHILIDGPVDYQQSVGLIREVLDVVEHRAVPIYTHVCVRHPQIPLRVARVILSPVHNRSRSCRTHELARILKTTSLNIAI